MSIPIRMNKTPEAIQIEIQNRRCTMALCYKECVKLTLTSMVYIGRMCRGEGNCSSVEE